MYVHPATIELPIIMQGAVIGHMPDIDCKLTFIDGEMIEVEVITDPRGHFGPPIRVGKSHVGTNERALWTAACAVADKPDVRREIDAHENAQLPAHMTREYVPVYISGSVG